MPTKDSLIKKLTRKPIPKNFTTQELNSLMSKCNCTKFSGGRGSSIAFFHTLSDPNRILQFDGPHPGKELYMYQIKMVIEFLEVVNEI